MSVSVGAAGSATAQAGGRYCGVMEVHRRLLTDVPSYAVQRDQIENLAFAFERGFGDAAPRGIVRIPVIVHVVWSNEEQNISDEQVRSQIDVLNADFRQANPDVSKVPPVWQSLVADAMLEFELATVDPEGQATSGIVRVATTTESFGSDDAVKSNATGGADPWPGDRYLNMWVCHLGGGLLGYAQFPGGPPETDGVVITYTAFGTVGTAKKPFHLGRTATHEVGHWLNLFHIWGDDGSGCSGTDHVADTPNQGGPNNGCPTFPKTTCSNDPHGDMFVNYMDYVDDECMVMFTAGQVKRIDACLEGSRRSLAATPQ